MQNFSGKIVAITGGARGIGSNIVERYAQQGAHVWICDIDEVAGNALATKLRLNGYKADYLYVDLARSGAPEEMVRKIDEKAGGLSVLVNNARSGSRTRFLEETEATWELGMSVTLKAAFFASQEAGKVMGKTKGGVIINISSVAAFMGTHESATYHIAKAAMVQMTRYMAVAAGNCGIRVNCICPGFIVQDEHRDRFNAPDNLAYRRQAQHCHPLGQVGNGLDIAEAALFLSSPSAQFITGEVIMLDGGATLKEQFCLLRDYNSKS